MEKGLATRRVVRFGIFEADLQAGELRKSGVRIKLQTQPFRVLCLLLERPGEIITRAEIVDELWGGDTFVDYDQSIGAVMRKLRRALNDSATAPRYIETLRQNGYRFLVPVMWDPAGDDESEGSSGVTQEKRFRLCQEHPSIVLSAAVGLALVLVLWQGGSRPSTALARNVSGSPAREASRNMDAYLAYQKGRYLWRTRTAAGVEKSIGYFQQALHLDRNYAAAYAGLADAYAILNFYTGRERKALIERARTASHRALDLDPSMAEAHATQAYLKFYYEWDWPGAENAFRKAIALDPNNATAHQWYAEYLFYMRRFPEAIGEINRAHELDPQSVVITFQLASPYFFSRRFDRAIEKIQEGLRMDPDFALGIYMLGTCYEQLGRFDEAVAEYRKIERTRLGLTGLGYAYGRSGRQEEARRILRKLLHDAQEDDLSAYHVARVYAGLGEHKETLVWLKKAQAARDERMVMLQVDPKLDTVRSDPKFNDLLQSIGLV